MTTRPCGTAASPAATVDAPPTAGQDVGGQSLVQRPQLGQRAFGGVPVREVRAGGQRQLGSERGLVWYRHAAGSADGGRQALGALDVVDDGGARHALEHIAGQQHQLAVG